MTRELKFRAWDELAKKMLHEEDVPHLALSLDGKFIQSGGGDSFVYCYQDFKLMQYTGLKDKNGVEIYEGDILRWYPQRPKNHHDYIIEWQSSGFYFGDWYENDFPDTEKESLVIGNIYESPELLEFN